MRIYYQYSTLKTLEPLEGDRVNEIGHCMALSRFAEVYYAGQRFRPELPDYGLKEYEGEIRVVPANWSIIRANRKVFLKCQGKRVWVSSPFDREMFSKADLIGAFTGVWSTYLREGKKLGPLNPDGERWPHAVPFYQTLMPGLMPLPLHPDTKKIQDTLDKKVVIGLFGRVVKSTYPTLLMKSLRMLQEKFGNEFVILVGSGKGKNSIPLPKHPAIRECQFSNTLMPYVYNACDVIIVSQRGVEWEFCGNLKTLEPMACGIPIICQDSPARREMLGDDYPLFMKDIINGSPEELVNKIQYAIHTKPYFSKTLSERSRFYSIPESVKRFQTLLTI